MLHRIFTGVVTAMLFCLVLAVSEYTPMIAREPNTYYFPFMTLVIIYIVYSVPIFLLIGIPCTILIDLITNRMGISNKSKLYLVQLGLYSSAGIVIALVFFGLTKGEILQKIWNYQAYVVYIVGSLIFYHVSLATMSIFKKMTEDIGET
ncbi:hypothetical protein [Brevibacillus laterosporus]|uniref:hypothetical protein n=1 Tax=Brevibacillus laterosporus TaxID=1465 RepID=UPI00265220D5|nr:hypothetical protein [Brevibacillus laterosporus]MDN9010188.1 hypothetical protein [Brevibacillus laterosporus]MDO0941442.1 hypothetical protein [Brevibacillus laterosporus]